ncbi:aspartate dehydrogenase [Elioraea sp.]|uniref:aspartate dehydrogenase n=1 Tax=Elioraea sp. TaxID=2185103 RepID=UPI0025C669BA|nr:aspartate dehydrogenase [Elioraea sp.]
MLTVGIAGLGAIGLKLAQELDKGVEGLRLVAVASRDAEKARGAVAGFRTPPKVVDLAGLAAEADVVVEAAPAAVFEAIVGPAVAAGRIAIVSSVGALLPRMHLVDAARASGGRIIVPTGALLGLDAVRAAAEGNVESVTLVTRKPPRGLAGAPYLDQHHIDVTTITTPTKIFDGTAREGAAGFPANVNVAAALALAGIGPDRTRLEIWADPTVTRNTHTVKVEADTVRLTMTIENVPSAENPRTGRITPLSLLACLRGLTATLKVGS